MMICVARRIRQGERHRRTRCGRASPGMTYEEDHRKKQPSSHEDRKKEQPAYDFECRSSIPQRKDRRMDDDTGEG